ncbi:MAG: hypothetical protein JO047_06945 [Alphaproteobacteria bacterium]|nr:hypothetical protein [Alphaproteobacteria bacterium]
MAGPLQAGFPEAPVLPVPGNNDAGCGDYQLQPEGPFLRDTLPVMRTLLRSGLAAEFAGDWSALGSYNVAHPTLARIRVVFANTVFFSRSYRNACGSGGDPAAQVLAWLRAQLERARRDGGKIWLIYHIPPGIDAFATASKHRCPETAVPMWEAADASRFAALAHEYADVIAASFAGHTHRDEFRLTGPPGRRDGFVLVVPALSPIFGQNPAFQVFGYDAGGGILDVATHYVANLDAAGDAPLDWQTEPSFAAEWQLPRLDLTTLETLQERIATDRETGTAWLLRYGVSRAGLWPLGAAQGLVPDQTFRAYSCAIGNDSVAGYQACRCGTPR